MRYFYQKIAKLAQRWGLHLPDPAINFYIENS